jgi:predicted DNA-binding protein with PD1-like motif
MIHGTSRHTRVIVCRLEKGEMVHDSLLALAEKERFAHCTVRGLGAFELCELVEYDQLAKAYKPTQTFECATEILSLVGNVSLKDGKPFVHLHTAVSRERESEHNRIEVLGGHLVRARAFAVELALEVYEDLTMVRVFDEATGLALWCPPLSR